ncbi:hypothetical protein [Qingshengfaniella alkalisoli]|uniref:Uncharacterized protein n=1 Tax=Qingshengfaniella alkalisoli TaxID=2599296 RepID=A0A5B8IVK0_9RHOB|nr:hypothetical protein [Qingshengfaniella alkalisoli]QDY68528.1 hypothetical protein FPZ52_02100 [Qingshengfaniella alkalisoli]
MDRLSLYITMMTSTVLTLTFVLVVLLLGWTGYVTVFGAIVLGLVLAYPISFLISRRIKRHDPHWDERKIEKADNPVFDPGTPEV